MLEKKVSKEFAEEHSSTEEEQKLRKMPSSMGIQISIPNETKFKKSPSMRKMK